MLDRVNAAAVDNIDWIVAVGQIDYPAALMTMEDCVAAIAARAGRERVWLIEHPPLYTSGTSADPAELIDPYFPVYAAGRGGRYTYHGPGQRIGYVMIDLSQRGRDVRRYVSALETWVIDALAILGVACWQSPDRIGIWTNSDRGEAKIGAIGVRIRRWVTFHGFSINVNPDLLHFGGIIPCGLADFAVTSLRDIGNGSTMADLDRALFASFATFLNRLEESVENMA